MILAAPVVKVNGDTSIRPCRTDQVGLPGGVLGLEQPHWSGRSVVATQPLCRTAAPGHAPPVRVNGR